MGLGRRDIEACYHKIVLDTFGLCLTTVTTQQIKRIEMELKRKKEEFRKLKKRDIAKVGSCAHA